jgi:CheY-like chemotaxis protein
MQINPLQILLADDDEGDRLLFTDAIKELKTKTIVHTVNDGIELMDYLAKEGNDLPQLLFLDLNMPRKNGFQCLKEIRSNYKLNDMVIAIFSTSLAEKDIDETFHNGANIYINKPTSFNKLKEALNKVVITAHTYQNTTFDISNFLLRV